MAAFGAFLPFQHAAVVRPRRTRVWKCGCDQASRRYVFRINGCEVEDPTIWQFVSAIDIGLGNTKWPTVTIRRAMECTDEIAEFVVEQPGPNVRSP
jgi:hypothetical protein